MSLSDQEIHDRVYPQSATDIISQKEIANVRSAIYHAMKVVNESVPKSREQSLAFTALEEACHWAVKGICRGQDV